MSEHTQALQGDLFETLQADGTQGPAQPDHHPSTGTAPFGPTIGPLPPIGQARQGAQPTAPPAALPAALWHTDPLAAFAAWQCARRVRGQPPHTHSQDQYRAMFGRFVAWITHARCGAQPATTGLALLRLGSSDIEAFLQQLRGGRLGQHPASASTRRRYLFLLHRTYEHLRLQGLLGPEALDDEAANPVAGLQELRPHHAHARPGRAMLLPHQEALYVRWCEAQPPRSWIDARNTALRLLLLATGITVAETEALRVGDVIDIGQPPAPQPWHASTLALRVAAHGRIAARTVPVARFARAALTRWLHVRQELGLAAPALFPSSVGGCAAPARLQALRRATQDSHSQRAPATTQAALHAAVRAAQTPLERPISGEEIYAIVRQALREIGYEGSRAGPATLRNSFLARHIAAGTELPRLRDWSGLASTEQLLLLQRQVPLRDHAQARALAAT